MILGMDGGVFAAWLLTILAAILCVLYGVYYECIKKEPVKKQKTPKQKQKQQEEE